MTNGAQSSETTGTPGAGAIAGQPGARRPDDVSPRDWLKQRAAAGQIAIVRSHFKSIYFIPMAVISLICGVWMVFATSGSAARPEELGAGYTVGLVWTIAFVFYMNMFVFEWSRTWTYVMLATMVALIFLGFALNSESFPIWRKISGLLGGTKFLQSAPTYFFFAAYFALCAFASWVKTRLNYVVVEANELQFNKNALFGDRERVSLLNPRIEVRVPDMLEYFHPFYRAGQIIIHAPDRTIVLDNVLQIRAIERLLDRLTGTLNVKLEHPRPS